MYSIVVSHTSYGAARFPCLNMRPRPGRITNCGTSPKESLRGTTLSPLVGGTGGMLPGNDRRRPSPCAALESANACRRCIR